MATASHKTGPRDSKGQIPTKIVKASGYDFYNFTPAEIQAGIAERIQHPEKIDQSTTSLCGVAAISYLYAKFRPDDYKQFCTKLHKYGEATAKAGYKLTTASDKHLEAYKKSDKGYPKTQKSQMAPVDFMLLSSLRDCQNLCFEYYPDDDQYISEDKRGFTLPDTVACWMKSILSFGEIQNKTWLFKINQVHWSWDHCISAIMDIMSRLRNGFQVALLIDARMISGGDAIVVTANHWVVLESIEIKRTEGYSIENSNVSLKIYTWGSIEIKEISSTHFYNTYFGYVCGKA